jgi:hypothetical protein
VGARSAVHRLTNVCQPTQTSEPESANTVPKVSVALPVYSWGYVSVFLIGDVR